MMYVTLKPSHKIQCAVAQFLSVPSVVSLDGRDARHVAYGSLRQPSGESHRKTACSVEFGGVQPPFP